MNTPDNKALADRLRDMAQKCKDAPGEDDEPYMTAVPGVSGYVYDDLMAAAEALTREPSPPSAQAGEVPEVLRQALAEALRWSAKSFAGADARRHFQILAGDYVHGLIDPPPQPQGDASGQVSGGGEVAKLPAKWRGQANAALRRSGTWNGNDMADRIESMADELEAALSTSHPQPDEGEVVVTRDEDGEIVMVSRQGSEGRILKVIATTTHAGGKHPQPSGDVAGCVDEDLRERVIEAVAEALGNAYDCMRVWSAWSVGTMSEDDFQLVSNDADRLGEIADAAIAALTAGVRVPAADGGADKLALSNDLYSVYGNTNRTVTDHLWSLGYRKHPTPAPDAVARPVEVGETVVIDGRRYALETVRTALLGLAADFTTEQQEASHE